MRGERARAQVGDADVLIARVNEAKVFEIKEAVAN
jgi:hypothetical protein